MKSSKKSSDFGKKLATWTIIIQFISFALYVIGGVINLFPVQVIDQISYYLNFILFIPILNVLYTVAGLPILLMQAVGGQTTFNSNTIFVTVTSLVGITIISGLLFFKKKKIYWGILLVQNILIGVEFTSGYASFTYGMLSFVVLGSLLINFVWLFVIRKYFFSQEY